MSDLVDPHVFLELSAQLISAVRRNVQQFSVSDTNLNPYLIILPSTSKYAFYCCYERVLALLS
jgi:hypothetical protein